MDQAATIKVSVLADGAVLLDKQPVSLADLNVALEQGVKSKAKVWYYRENPDSEGPPVVDEVIQLITSHRLPVRLCTQPDFSDSVAPASTIEQNFASVRRKAGQGRLIVKRHDDQYVTITAKAKETVAPQAVAAVEHMLPSRVPRNVAVIGDTSWAHAAKPTVEIASRAIPFFGILLGFATIGHAVWVFDAANAFVVTAGCRDADVLIVDSARLPELPENWQKFARAVMRHQEILIHDRETGQARKLPAA